MKKFTLIGLCLLSIFSFGQTFQKTFFSTGYDMNHFNIEQTSDGNYIIGGDYFNSTGYSYYYISKVNPSGTVL